MLRVIFRHIPLNYGVPGFHMQRPIDACMFDEQYNSANDLWEDPVDNDDDEDNDHDDGNQKWLLKI